jgi:hypothetical protein
MVNCEAMKHYDLILKNDKERSYRRISLLLLIINFTSIAFVSYLKDFTKWGLLILALIAAFSVFVSFYFKTKNERITFSAVFFLFSLAWQTSGYWIPAALNLVLLILNGIASQKPVVTINKDQITYPAFPKKQFHWKALNNIMLKDGLLSIDFKNNKLIQQLVDDTHTRIDEKEFNEFCQQQLNK